MYNGLEYKNRVVVGLIIIFALLFFCAGISFYQFFLPVITLKVDSEVIRQEDVIPEFTVYAEYNGKHTVILDDTTGFTTDSLLARLNAGEGYILTHSVDNLAEGIYDLNLDFDESIKKQLVGPWNLKVRYRVEDGTLEVRNKYGDWEGDKFKLLDGTYAIGWLNIWEDTYYFDEEGKKVTGEKTIGLETYYFQEDGKFDTEKNKINPNRPMIALTFDDGPGIGTPRIIEALQQHHAKATFFMLGPRVVKYPETLLKMKESECEIASHTTNHLKLTDYPAEGVANEVNFTKNVIASVVGHAPTLVRPPYGAVNEVVQSVVDVPIALWSVDTLDWQLKDATLICDYVLNTVKDGDIVLLHDIYEATVQAAVELIPLLQEQGYQLVTVGEMARARGVAMERGVKYYSFYNQ